MDDELPDTTAPFDAYFEQHARFVREREAKAARLRAHPNPRDLLESATQLQKYFSDGDNLDIIERALAEELRRRELDGE